MHRNDLPNACDVHSEVIVDQDVSESGNRAPVNLGMEGFQTIADPLSGFGESLEIAQNRVLNQFRLAKGLLAVPAIPGYTPDTIEDVMDVEPVVLHKGIAS
jgi:hypothetical protein